MYIYHRYSSSALGCIEVRVTLFLAFCVDNCLTFCLFSVGHCIVRYSINKLDKHKIPHISNIKYQNDR